MRRTVCKLLQPLRQGLAPGRDVLIIVAQVGALGQGLANLIPQLTALTNILPPATLAWKLRLLAAGMSIRGEQVSWCHNALQTCVGYTGWGTTSHKNCAACLSCGSALQLTGVALPM